MKKEVLVVVTTRGRVSDRFEMVRRSWQTFQRGELPTGVRQPILRSWQRSQAAGVNTGLPGGILIWNPLELMAAQSANWELLEAAHLALMELKQSLEGSGQVMVLLDPAARALTVEGDIASLSAAEQICLVPGSDWSEARVGTNAMGTAHVERCPVTVLTAEHYLERLHSWSCVAAPIRHPRTGTVVGLLDLSGDSMAVGPHTELALQSTVSAIEARLTAGDLLMRSALLEAYTDRLTSQRQAALAAVDRFGQMVKAAGGEWADEDLAARVAAEMRGLLQTGEERKAEFSAGGEGPVTLTLRPVRWRGRIVGALAECAAPPRRPSPSFAAAAGKEGLIGRNPAWLATLERAMRAARTDSTILITGETGTGKEVLAKAIHRASSRSKGPWVAVNCGALPSALAASELFGYVGGAFTGANPKGSTGLVEAANGGTLFLDEVGELAPEVQVALLRFLQEQEVVRVGGHHPTPVNVRVIAATNRDLQAMVNEGAFRQDLFFRLNVVPLRIPPLRERREDILPLVDHAYRRLGAIPPDLGFASCQHLTGYAWPGNVREVLNLVEQAVALNEDPASLLPLPSLASRAEVPLGEFGEEEQIRRALDGCHGNAAAAARQLGISRTTLYRKLEHYGIRLRRQVD